MILGTLIAMCTIIHSSDGAVDDFTTTGLVAAALKTNAFECPAIIITNADCEPISALSAGLKTVKFLNTEVALSSSRVWIQFPWKIRWDSIHVDQLPCLNQTSYSEINPVEGNQLLISSLEKASSVKLLATGPLTTLADVFKARPELMAKVSEMHWMGGAIDVPGNILESPEIPKPVLNEYAEWNVFSDAEAALWIFNNASFDIYMYPLDICEQAIPKDFLKILKNKKQTIYSRYVDECFQIVAGRKDYRMWDIVAGAGIFFPEALEPPVIEKLRIELGPKAHGATMRDEEGRDVFVYKKFKGNSPEQFYETLAEYLTY